MFIKRLFLSIALFCLIVGGITYYRIQSGYKHAHFGKGPVVVVTHNVSFSPLEHSFNSNGTLHADHSTAIKPEISGYITSIACKEGEMVQKGDLLFSLDGNIYQAEQEKAQANFALQKLSFQRTQELQRKGASSLHALDTAENEFKSAKASLVSAQLNANKASITAPFTGKIGLRTVNIGDYIQANTVLSYLETLNPMFVTFAIPENKISSLHVGQKIQVTVDARPGQMFEGTIIAQDTRIMSHSHNLKVKAQIENTDETLLPGMFAHIIWIMEKKENALMIPEEAIVYEAGMPHVWKVENNLAKITEVTLGFRKNAQVEILSGLSENDIIVTAGHMKLTEGATVIMADKALPSKGSSL